MNALLLVMLMLPGYSHSGAITTSVKSEGGYAITVTTCAPPYKYLPVYADENLEIPMPNPLYVESDGDYNFYTVGKDVRMIIWVPDEEAIVVNCSVKEKK